MSEIVLTSVSRIGMALVHSLWQGAIVLVLYFILTWISRNYPSYIRYRIGLVLIGVVLCSFLSIMLGMHTSDNSTEFQAVRDLIGHTHRFLIIAPNPVVEYFITQIGKLRVIMPVVFFVWLAVVFILVRRFVIALNGIRTFVSACILAPEEVQAVAEQCKARLGIQVPIRVLISEKTSSPMMVGGRHPSIVLSREFLTNYSVEQQTFFIMHELAHVQRRDFAVNIVLTIVDIIFFFNPFVRCITESMRRERELSCDEMVVSITGQKMEYARALTDMYDEARAHALAMGLSSGPLSYRVYGLFKPKKTLAFTVSTFTIGLLALVIVTGLIDCSRMTSYSVNGHRISIAQFHSIEHEIYAPVKNIQKSE